MALQNELKEIHRLRMEYAPFLPLNDKQKNIFWQKMRLEWNYNSNHIEGNTLTYKETELLILFGKTNGGHTIREYDEMRAHDAAIHLVQEWAMQDRPITESEIRQLNKIILFEPFFKEAITSTLQPTMVKIIPGTYKSTSNHVLRPNGEIFRYAEPEEVSIKMQELIKWYFANEDLGVVEKAAMLHYQFVRIHPFGDGNGRIARLLLNYHLMKEDYPPIVNKSGDKRHYLDALNRADIGEMEIFIEFIAIQVKNSYEILLKVAKGESIEDVDEWRKMATLISKAPAQALSEGSVEERELRFRESIAPSIYQVTKEIQDVFSSLFKRINIKVQAESFDITRQIMQCQYEEALLSFKSFLKSSDFSFSVQIMLMDYQRNGLNPFPVESKFNFYFHKYSYEFNMALYADGRIKKGYDEVFTDEDLLKMKNFVGGSIIRQIEKHTSRKWT